MSSYPFVVNKSITSRMDSSTLREIDRNLWPVDCQSCGRSLGAEPPSLVVNDIGVLVAASLHHMGCQSPQWNDGNLSVSLSQQNFLSYRTFSCLIPAEARGQRRDLPFAFVNPALEQVNLTNSSEARWAIATVPHFRECGLTGMAMNNPAPDTRAMVGADGIMRVHLDRSGEGWEFDCRMPGMLEAIRQLGGVTLGVTTSYLPNEHFTTTAGFGQALQSGEVALGWIPLQ